MQIAEGCNRTFSLHILIAFHEAQLFDMTDTQCFPLFESRSRRGYIQYENQDKRLNGLTLQLSPRNE